MKNEKTLSFEGEYWGVKRKYRGRFKFTKRMGKTFVSYWDSDISWGQRRLYELTNATKASSSYAFATWHFGKSVVYFLFKHDKKALIVENITILPKFQYHTKESFKKALR